MSPEAATYLAKVEAMGQRPLLSDPDARRRFYTNIRIQLVRQQNLSAKGKTTQFPPSDISALITALTHLLEST